MTLYEKIIFIYPQLNIEDFCGINATIFLQNYSDLKGDYIKEWNRVYTSNRYKTDPIFALKINQRSRVRAILKNNKNCKRTACS